MTNRSFPGGGPPFYAANNSMQEESEFTSQTYTQLTHSPLLSPFPHPLPLYPHSLPQSQPYDARQPQYHHQGPLDRYIHEEQSRNYFTTPYASHTQGFGRANGGTNGIFAGQRAPTPILSIPNGNPPRYNSPVQSQGGISSALSSAQSPGAFPDFNDTGYYTSPGPSASSDGYSPRAEFELAEFSQYQNNFLQELGTGVGNGSAYEGGNGGYARIGEGGISLSQVQGFPDMDVADAGFGEGEDGDNGGERVGDAWIDEGYAGQSTLQSSSSHSQPQFFDSLPQSSHSNNKSFSNGYPQYRDEGLGTSVPSEPSPNPSAVAMMGQEEDIDAEGDIDDEEVDQEQDDMEESNPHEEPEAPESDQEYTPRASKRKRTSTSYLTTSSHLSKRSRQSTSNTKTPRTNQHNHTHSHASATSIYKSRTKSTSLDTSIRPFTCVFAFATCPSTFASKNEWKRHVNTQHTQLMVYVCSEGVCAQEPTEFNRKDLFTQHLRRMHGPKGLRKSKGNGNNNSKAGGNARGRGGNGVKGGMGMTGADNGKEEWEEKIKRLQKNSESVKRLAPTKLGCPVPGCEEVFEGREVWDQRMEHVGKHLENTGGRGVEVRDENDELLVEWALQEGVIKEGNGGWRLVVKEKGRGGGKGKEGEGDEREGEVDAEGEEE